MQGMNRVSLVGRLAQDVELKSTTNGISVAQITVAVGGRKNSQGVQEVEWITVQLWRKTAEFAAEYLGKGRLVSVEGRLHVQKWEKDGIKKQRMIIVASNIQSLDSRKPATVSDKDE